MQIESLKIRPIVSIILLIIVTFFCKPSSVEGASVVRADKDIYNQGEMIRVYFTSAPGNDSDWMCIVPAGYPDTDAGDYKYMPRGSSQGYITFDPRPPGQYEVRAYYDYRRNGYVVSGRYAFSVTGAPVEEEALAQQVEPIKPNNSLEADLPPSIPFVAPPNVVVLPGTDVYAIPDVEAEIYFQGGWWWRQWRGNWYRSTYYDHGWSHYRDYPSWHRKIPSDWRRNYSNHIWNGRPWNPPYINHGNLNNHWRGGYWRNNQGLVRPTPSRPAGGVTLHGGGKLGADPGRRALPGGSGGGRTGGRTDKPTLHGGGRPSGDPDGRNVKGGVKSGRTDPDGRMNRSHDGGSNRGNRR